MLVCWYSWCYSKSFTRAAPRVPREHPTISTPEQASSSPQCLPALRSPSALSLLRFAARAVPVLCCFQETCKGLAYAIGGVWAHGSLLGCSEVWAAWRERNSIMR